MNKKNMFETRGTVNCIIDSKFPFEHNSEATEIDETRIEIARTSRLDENGAMDEDYLSFRIKDNEVVSVRVEDVISLFLNASNYIREETKGANTKLKYS